MTYGKLSSLAVLFLAIGVLVYIVDRTPTLLTSMLGIQHTLTSSVKMFGNIGYQLPSFLHTFAFIVFTFLVIRPGATGRLFICLFWLLIGLMFELGQYQPVASWIANQLHHTNNNWVLNTVAYFANGTFDSKDLLAITLGGILAFVLMIVTPQYTKQIDEKKFDIRLRN